MISSSSPVMSIEELTKIVMLQQEQLNQESAKWTGLQKESVELSQAVNEVLGLQIISNGKAQLASKQLNEITQQLYNTNQQLAEIQGRKIEKIVGGVSTIIKIVMKIGGKEIVFQITKLFSLQAAKTASKICAKVIPFISLAIGIGACGYRCWNGQYLKGGGELISGAIGCIPGIGTILAIALDTIMAGHDIYECYHSHDEETPDIFEYTLSLENAYDALSIKNKNPTQKEVDYAYRYAVKRVHSDSLAYEEEEEDGGGLNVKKSDELVSFLTDCKEFIYEEHKWIDLS
ncbi:MAG: hypothetical protein H0T62_07055 [Parachlamydiaceae bacterium]|nr:hypothetical protein [Parachlamydiaceae bacterium]